jgi:serine/threonine protein kinase
MPAHGRLVLPERYQVDREIGRGGMSVVYRAHDRQLRREVAIKVLSEEFSSAVGGERFAREIAVLAKLVHPRIVGLVDSGEANGRLFYVMPFVAGDTLRARLLRERRLSPASASAIAADIAEALAFAHQLGVIHRDIKPENVFAIGDRAMLADFGIARIIGNSEIDAPSYRTTAGVAVGTMAYMSPEQAAADAHIDGRSDLYNLGCVLYELLTGKPPFSARTPLALMAKHFNEAPRPLAEHGLVVPAELEAVVMRLLAKDPDARPARAADVAALLRGTRQPETATGFYPALKPTPPRPSDADRSAR